MSDLGITEADAVGHDDPYVDRFLPHEGDLDDKAEKRKLGLAFFISVGWLAIVIGLAVFAPYLSFLKNPDVNFIIPGERPPYPPSSEFWFGTDQDARDMFSRTVYGARTSLTVGFAAIAFGLLVGGTLGLLAG